jgi:hypothetical protein
VFVALLFAFILIGFGLFLPGLAGYGLLNRLGRGVCLASCFGRR